MNSVTRTRMTCSLLLLAAMLECTDRQFLPPSILEQMTAEGARAKLQARLTVLKHIVKEL